MRRWFSVNPYSAMYGLSTSFHIARAAGVEFRNGAFGTNCFIEVPWQTDDERIIRKWLNKAKIKFELVERDDP